MSLITGAGQQRGLGHQGSLGELELIRELFETLPEGVVYYDADGAVVGANPAASEILRIDPAAMSMWPLVRDRHAIHEDGSPYDPADFPVMVALRTGQIVANQLRRTSGSGSPPYPTRTSPAAGRGTPT